MHPYTRPYTRPSTRHSTLVAPPPWRNIDFISDLHLQASEPLTFEAWQRYMAHTRADAVFILGDLFEVWVGDDAAFGGAAGDDMADGDMADGDMAGDGATGNVLRAGGFESQCGAVLRHTAARIPVFFMHGNRDFLVGATFMAQCQCTLLDDPTVLDFGGQRWLLSHGDALCLADTDYLKFRAGVRSAAWQQDFLAKPLAERRAVARDLRVRSEAKKQSAATYADVDADAALTWLREAGAGHMIHGHTHKPADHVLGPGLQRIVLSDWDMAAQPPRAEVLRLSRHGTDTNTGTDHDAFAEPHAAAAAMPPSATPGVQISRIAPDSA